MSEIKIQDAVKRYGDNTVISGLNLHIHDGELFTLLGPSGCGKTTLLRMIAGFNSIEGGEFYFNEKKINDMDPSKRNIGMVFQNYAIFPHLSVRQNVEFGLKNRKLDKQTIKRESDKFLKAMQIEEYQDRLPEKLSGGQQQRVALARALCIKPDVLLMDEPLSNLDAKLRLEMRQVIRDIQREVGITTVYVTHDQEEAMAISDHIAVMKDGVIQHLGIPQDIYHRPKNVFVATFIGRTNILNAKVQNNVIQFKDGITMDMQSYLQTEDQEVLVSIRPEEFVMVEDQDHIFEGVVRDSVYLGLQTHYYVTLSSGEEVEVVQESTIDGIIRPKTKVLLGVKRAKINVFDKVGAVSLTRERS